MANVALLALSVMASGWLWFHYLRSQDMLEPEPLKVVLRVGLVGGLASALAAGVANSAFIEALDLPADLVGLGVDQAFWVSLFVGINEETLKALATYLLIRKLPHFNEPLDAVVYATSVALGFAVFENFGYVLEGGFMVLVARTITAMPLHVGLAALWGLGLARMRFADRPPSSLGGYVAAAALTHAAYDFVCLSTQQMYPLAQLVLAAAFVVALMRLMRSRFAYLRQQSPFLAAGACAACGQDNRPGDTFCRRCGAPLAQELGVACVSCRSKLPLGVRFCPACGAPVSGG